MKEPNAHEVTYRICCGSQVERRSHLDDAVDCLAGMMYILDRAALRYRLQRDGEVSVTYGFTTGYIEMLRYPQEV